MNQDWQQGILSLIIIPDLLISDVIYGNAHDKLIDEVLKGKYINTGKKLKKTRKLILYKIRMFLSICIVIRTRGHKTDEKTLSVLWKSTGCGVSLSSTAGGKKFWHHRMGNKSV